MELTLYTAQGERASGGLSVSDGAFAATYNEPLVHQIVTAYMARGRSGSRAQKSRAEVRGGGTKPWRQKGIGRARAGSIRSPLWRGGGVTFAARPADYAQKVNKKMYRAALRSIVSELARQERLMVVEDFPAESPKTKDLVLRLKKMGLSDVLIVTEGENENLLLASRNVHWADVRAHDRLDPVSLIAYDKVVITVPALRRLEERLA